MRYLSLLALLLVLTPSLAQPQTGEVRVYVRRIEFLQTSHIDDKVLRRELRQYEGTYLNTTALEESRLRLERLPYVASARVALRPVAKTSGLVDILITIEEAPARRYGLGGGYSESSRASINGYFINENLLGTGQRLAVRVETSEIRTAIDLSHTNPYARPNAVSRTLAFSLRRIDQLTADTSDLEADLTAVRLEYAYPVAQHHTIAFGLALQDVELRTGRLSSSQLQNWVRDNGNSTSLGSIFSTDYLTVEFRLGWHHDTRNQELFPDRGMQQLLRIKFAAPGSDVAYYTADYELSKYWPLKRGWTAKFGTRLGFGAKYASGTSTLPPNFYWFAGGPDSVRGYRENRLGPKDSLGNPYGGNLFVVAQSELLLPLPGKWRKRLRIGFFYDVGNVFSTENLIFLDDAGQRLDYGFEFSELRHSVGIAAQYLSPIGLLRLSYGEPLNAKEDNPNRFLRDDIERFQVTVGLQF